MSITFNIKLHHIAKKSGEYSVLLKITHNRKPKSVTLPVSVSSSKHFNPHAKRKHWVRKSDPEYVPKNNKILNQLVLYENAYDELSRKGLSPSLQMIVNKAKNESSEDIIEYSEKRIAIYKKKGQYNHAKHTKSAFNKLSAYATENKYTELSFDDITVSFINDYEAHLSSLGNKINTIAKNMKIIKAIYNNAISEDIVGKENNAFNEYKIKYEKTNNKALSIKELNKLEEKVLDFNSKLWHTKNYFMFCYYCAGIRISDLMTLKWSSIKNGRLEYRMRKNNKLQNILLSKKANQILESYKPKTNSPSKFIFPILNQQYDYSDGLFLINQISSKTTLINRNLKKLATEAEIETDITTHMARHTFSDIARQKGADVYNISKLLRHSDLKTTEGYLASIDQEAADDVLQKL